MHWQHGRRRGEWLSGEEAPLPSDSHFFFRGVFHSIDWNGPGRIRTGTGTYDRAIVGHTGRAGKFTTVCSRPAPEIRLPWWRRSLRWPRRPPPERGPFSGSEPWP